MTDAAAWGIQPGYHDAFGHWHEVPDPVLRSLVAAMGADPDGPGPPEPPAVPGGPHACAAPPAERCWGPAVQLYAARSTASWGIGDLADLATVGTWAAGRGAEVVLVNPLDAVAPTTPREPSPYTPATRRFLDPVYLRVEHVPGADHADLGDLPARGRALNATRRIDRDSVVALKQAALRRIWDQIPEVHEDPAFASYRDERGEPLRRFSAWTVAVGRRGTDVEGWPAGLRDPDGAGIQELAATDEAAFHAWQQYCLDTQLAEAARACPLLRDLPVGFARDGFDAWTWRDQLADGVTIGAPPDLLGPRGQDWELPAFAPHALLGADCGPLRETLRAAMRHAAGLRIDHVLGLFRLFWIPPGGTALEGTYVRQPTDHLLAVVAAASRDRGTWVVGEDLGTIEEGVRPILRSRDMLRYQVLWFEDDPPETWEEMALASVSTHDLPTIAGLWTGADLDQQRAAGVDPDADWQGWVRGRLAAAAGIPHDADAATAIVALHALLARASSRVVVAQLDDLVGAVERPNLPGTRPEQRPENWSLALPVPVDALEGHELAGRVADVLRRAR